MLLVASLMLFPFIQTSVSEEDLEATYSYGWGLIGLMLFTMAVNAMIALNDSLQSIWLSIKYLTKKFFEKWE